MAGGRPAKPQEVKDLEGNPGKRKRKPARVNPKGKLAPPPHLDGLAREAWDRIVGAMPPNLYKSVDRDLLASYCEAVQTRVECWEHIRENGYVLEGARGGAIANPAVAAMQKAATQMVQVGAKLGLDPVSRANLGAGELEEKPQSKFEGLVSISGGKV